MSIIRIRRGAHCAETARVKLALATPPRLGLFMTLLISEMVPRNLNRHGEPSDADTPGPEACIKLIGLNTHQMRHDCLLLLCLRKRRYVRIACDRGSHPKSLCPWSRPASA